MGDWDSLRCLALSWFKNHYLKCSERATLVKTWLPAKYEGSRTWLDQLVYDRALVLVRVLVLILHLAVLISPPESPRSAQGIVGPGHKPGRMREALRRVVMVPLRTGR